MSGTRPVRDDDQATREFGGELLARLHGLLRAGRLYDAKNRSFQQHLDEMRALLARSTGEEVTLASMGDTVAQGISASDQ